MTISNYAILVKLIADWYETEQYADIQLPDLGTVIAFVDEFYSILEKNQCDTSKPIKLSTVTSKPMTVDTELGIAAFECFGDRCERREPDGVLYSKDVAILCKFIKQTYTPPDLSQRRRRHTKRQYEPSKPSKPFEDDCANDLIINNKWPQLTLEPMISEWVPYNAIDAYIPTDEWREILGSEWSHDESIVAENVNSKWQNFLIVTWCKEIGVSPVTYAKKHAVFKKLVNEWTTIFEAANKTGSQLSRIDTHYANIKSLNEVTTRRIVEFLKICEFDPYDINQSSEEFPLIPLVFKHFIISSISDKTRITLADKQQELEKSRVAAAALIALAQTQIEREEAIKREEKAHQAALERTRLIECGAQAKWCKYLDTLWFNEHKMSYEQYSCELVELDALINRTKEQKASVHIGTEDWFAFDQRIEKLLTLKITCCKVYNTFSEYYKFVPLTYEKSPTELPIPKEIYYPFAIQMERDALIGDVCCVCRELLSSLDTHDIQSLACNHWVCKTCLGLTKYEKCPMCRREFILKNAK